jgi:hypothetical protein
MAAREHYVRPSCHSMEPVNGNMQSTWLSIMMEEAVYIRVSDTYLFYCKEVWMTDPPDCDQEYIKIKMHGYGKMNQVEKPWVTHFRWLITGPSIGMTQCKYDEFMFVLHDTHGRLIMWAVIFPDDVVYGGSQTKILKDALEWYAPLSGMTEVGTLDMLLGLEREMAKESELGKYLRSLDTPFHGTHAKCGMIYHEGFHWPNVFNNDLNDEASVPVSSDEASASSEDEHGTKGDCVRVDAANPDFGWGVAVSSNDWVLTQVSDGGMQWAAKQE